MVHFVRLMRAAGVRAGTASTLNALAQVEAAGIERRADIRAALRSTLISRPEHRELFDIAFDPSGRTRRFRRRCSALCCQRCRGGADAATTASAATVD